MKTLMLLVSLATTLAPATVLAAGCAHEEAAMSCADGMKWNPDTRACETMSS